MRGLCTVGDALHCRRGGAFERVEKPLFFGVPSDQNGSQGQRNGMKKWKLQTWRESTPGHQVVVYSQSGVCRVFIYKVTGPSPDSDEATPCQSPESDSCHQDLGAKFIE